MTSVFSLQAHLERIIIHTRLRCRTHTGHPSSRLTTDAMGENRRLPLNRVNFPVGQSEPPSEQRHAIHTRCPQLLVRRRLAA
jgi:hypothetical protein